MAKGWLTFFGTRKGESGSPSLSLLYFHVLLVHPLPSPFICSLSPFTCSSVPFYLPPYTSHLLSAHLLPFSCYLVLVTCTFVTFHLSSVPLRSNLSIRAGFTRNPICNGHFCPPELKIRLFSLHLSCNGQMCPIDLVWVAETCSNSHFCPLEFCQPARL